MRLEDPAAFQRWLEAELRRFDAELVKLEHAVTLGDMAGARHQLGRVRRKFAALRWVVGGCA